MKTSKIIKSVKIIGSGLVVGLTIMGFLLLASCGTSTSEHDPDSQDGCILDDDQSNDTYPDEKTCYVSGCSGQLCWDQKDIMTTCEWKDWYVCFKNAICQVQCDGNCGWTMDEKLIKCIEENDG